MHVPLRIGVAFPLDLYLGMGLRAMWFTVFLTELSTKVLQSTGWQKVAHK